MCLLADRFKIVMPPKCTAQLEDVKQSFGVAIIASRLRR